VFPPNSAVISSVHAMHGLNDHVGDEVDIGRIARAALDYAIARP
jgi:hypothetical protein